MEWRWIRWFSFLVVGAFMAACGEQANLESFSASSDVEPSGTWQLAEIDGEAVADQDFVKVRVVNEGSNPFQLNNEADCSGTLLAQAEDGQQLYLIENRDPSCFVDFPRDSVRTEVHEILYRGVSYRLVSVSQPEISSKRLELLFDSKLYVFHPVSR